MHGRPHCCVLVFTLRIRNAFIVRLLFIYTHENSWAWNVKIRVITVLYMCFANECQLPLYCESDEEYEGAACQSQPLAILRIRRVRQ